MGATGAIYWFTERHDLELEPTTLALLRLFGAVSGVNVVHYDREDTNWARFQEEEVDSEWPVATTPEKSSEPAVRVGTIEEAAALMVPGVFQFCEPYLRDGAPIGMAIRRDIPQEYSGGCELSAPAVGVGGCDIWDLPWDAPDDEPVYYGRSQFYVSLSGCCTPRHSREYEKRLVQVPEVRQLERDVESVLGPVKRCIIWSV